MQVPLLPLFAEATASPVHILCRLLPAAAAAQLPQSFLRQLPAQQAEYLDASRAGAAGDLRYFALAAAAWAAQMDSNFLPQPCVSMQDGLRRSNRVRVHLCSGYACSSVGCRQSCADGQSLSIATLRFHAVVLRRCKPLREH